MKMSKNKQWWNNLDKIWKDEFVSNLLSSPDYLEKRLLTADVFAMIEKSDEIITAIVNLERLHISRKVLFDMTPVFYLKNIIDFHIEPSDWKEADASFLYLYPKHLRSKVHRLDIDGLIFDGDLSPLIDFVNLEVLNCQSCHIESLDGIQKLKNLKVINADQGNFYSDLNPLRGLGIIDLNIQFTKVTDISPLIYVPTLEHLDISYLKIKDLSPLLKIPNLQTVTMGNERTLTVMELKIYLDKRGALHPGLTSIKETPIFEKTQRWYLLPFNPSEVFFGPLSAGRVLVDPSAFNKPDINDPSWSLLIIIDFQELCRHLSTTLIYPVELDPDTLVDKINGHSWYVSKVKLLKPVDIFQLLRTSFHNIHHGSINFSGLVTIHAIYFDGCVLPEKSVFPDIAYERLSFSNMTIPASLELPDHFTGTLVFNDCSIPSRFKLPSTMNGELAIRFPKISGRLQLPSNGEYQLVIPDESELLNYDLPDSVKDKAKIDPDDLPF